MKKLILLIILLCLPFYSLYAIDQTQSGATTTGTEKANVAAGHTLKSIVPSDGTLGTAVKEGNLEVKHIPQLLFYWINYLTYIAGSISVLMIAIGGLQYAIGSVSDEKERGKKTVLYALVGTFITFMSWVTVNIYIMWWTA